MGGFTVSPDRILASKAPENALIVGYGALILALTQKVPLPKQLALIGPRHKVYSTDQWKVFTPVHNPPDTIIGHLSFALKYEGVNLLALKRIFEAIGIHEFQLCVSIQINSKTNRRLWFLYEWLLGHRLDIEDLQQGNYELVIDESLQYGNPKPISVPRQRVRNNLTGNVGFCPLISRTPTIDRLLEKNLSKALADITTGLDPSVLHNLKLQLRWEEANASFGAGGMHGEAQRTLIWASMLAEAGHNELSLDDVLQVQKYVLEGNRFIAPGLRPDVAVTQNRYLMSKPAYEETSGDWQDLRQLMSDLLDVKWSLANNDFNPVLLSAMVGFSVLFIRPFNAGDKALQAYLICHTLAFQKFSPVGFVLPVSKQFEDLSDYVGVLGTYGTHLTASSNWSVTPDQKFFIAKETFDLYRYFDLTDQAEFLLKCIEDLIDNYIPELINKLTRFQTFKIWAADRVPMPDRLVSLLFWDFEQRPNGFGQTRKRLGTDFDILTDDEIELIQAKYVEILNSQNAI